VLVATAGFRLRLSLEGHTFMLVGTDEGLLGAPVAGLTEFLLAAAQRIELIVHANGTPNGRYRLRALRFEADFLNSRHVPRPGPLDARNATNDLPAAPAHST